MLAGAELRRALETVPLIERRGPWVRAIDARHLTAAPPGAPPDAPPQPLWGGGARLHCGRFTPKGSFDTLYLASDLVTAGLEIGAVFGTVGAVSPTKDPFTVVTVNGRLTTSSTSPTRPFETPSRRPYPSSRDRGASRATRRRIASRAPRSRASASARSPRLPRSTPSPGS